MDLDNCLLKKVKTCFGDHHNKQPNNRDQVCPVTETTCVIRQSRCILWLRQGVTRGSRQCVYFLQPCVSARETLFLRFVEPDLILSSSVYRHRCFTLFCINVSVIGFITNTICNGIVKLFFMLWHQYPRGGSLWIIDGGKRVVSAHQRDVWPLIVLLNRNVVLVPTLTKIPTANFHTDWVGSRRSPANTRRQLNKRTLHSVGDVP